jgi:hypothetical protein
MGPNHGVLIVLPCRWQRHAGVQETHNPADEAKIQSASASTGGFNCRTLPDPDGVDAVDCMEGSLDPGQVAVISVDGTSPDHALTLPVEGRVQSKDFLDTNSGNNSFHWATTTVTPLSADKGPCLTSETRTEIDSQSWSAFNLAIHTFRTTGST